VDGQLITGLHAELAKNPVIFQFPPLPHLLYFLIQFEMFLQLFRGHAKQGTEQDTIRDG